MVDGNDGFKRSNRTPFSTDRSIGRSRALISNRLGETIRYKKKTIRKPNTNKRGRGIQI